MARVCRARPGESLGKGADGSPSARRANLLRSRVCARKGARLSDFASKGLLRNQPDQGGVFIHLLARSVEDDGDRLKTPLTHGVRQMLAVPAKKRAQRASLRAGPGESEAAGAAERRQVHLHEAQCSTW